MQLTDHSHTGVIPNHCEAPELFEELPNLLAAAGTVVSAEIRGLSGYHATIVLDLKGPVTVVSGLDKRSSLCFNGDTRHLIVYVGHPLRPELCFFSSLKSGDTRVMVILELGCRVNDDQQGVTIDDLRAVIRMYASMLAGGVWSKL